MTVPFRDALAVWARVGLLGFGGPAGQIALLHREVVEQRAWVAEPRFLHALNFCMLLPGPEAQQLATYLGWMMHGVRGGIAAGLLFVLPGLAVILALSLLYASLGEVAWVQALFYGLKPAVLAVVVDALVRIGKRSLTGPLRLGLAAAAFLALFVLGLPFPLVVLAAGVIGLAWVRVPAPGADETLPPAPSARVTLGTALACLALWLAPVVLLALLLGPNHVQARVAGFFSVMATVTFGGAYAVLAYVAQQAVEVYGWLAPGEMLDGLALAETTPGPLVLVLVFVGFLAGWRDPGLLDPALAGLLAGLLTAWVTFAPSFLWIFAGAPWMERLRHNRRLAGALAAITAAVVGVILNLALWFALHVLFARQAPVALGPLDLDLPVPASLDPVSALLAGAALLAMLRFKLGMLPTLAACALAGLAWRLLQS